MRAWAKTLYSWVDGWMVPARISATPAREDVPPKSAVSQPKLVDAHFGVEPPRLRDSRQLGLGHDAGFWERSRGAVMSSAISRSLRLVRWELRRSMSKATSLVQPWRAMRTP